MMNRARALLADSAAVMRMAEVGRWCYEAHTDRLYADEIVRSFLGLGAWQIHCTWNAAMARVDSRHERVLRAFLDAARESDKACSMEIEAIADGGEARYALLRARGCRGADGQRRVLGILIDDSERARINRDNEAKLRAVAHGVPNFLLFLNRDLRVEFCNDHFLKNTQWTRDAALGRHISEILGPQRYADRRANYERALAGETFTYESTGAVGNEAGYFRFYYQPSFDEQGNVRGVFSTATDISERRAAEVALETKQAELTRSNEDLEQFAYVASHDLKAPLRAMALLVQWIRADLGAYEAGNIRENLTLLEQRTHRFGRLLDDLLEYSRVGRKIGEHCSVDCNALVRDVIQLCGAPESMNISIATELPTLATYAAPLEQIFRNLIGNAIKHHPGPTGVITVAHEEHEDFYVFSVQDDGEGIPLEYADRVFQMFQTLKPGDEVEGSGMGLTIVSRIVAWQGGRVWFEPVPEGRGTIFKFQWQKAAQPAAAARTDEVAQWRMARR